MDQQNTRFLKHLENKVKPLAGKKKLRKGRFYYFQGGMEGETGPIRQEHLDNEHEITSIFKFSALLASVSVDLGKLGNDLHKGDHITVVGEEGNSWIEITITQ